MIPKLFKVISGKYVDDTLNYLLSHQGGGMQMNKLESDLTFVNGTSPSGYFPEAFYYTDYYEIKYNNGETIDTIFGTNEVVYWNPDNLTWVGSEKCMIYNTQSGTWSIIFNQEIDRINFALSNKQNTLTAGSGIEISNNVISATGGGGGVSVTNLTQDIVLTGNTIPLSTGFYNTGNYGLFIGSQTPQNLIFGAGEIIYVDTSTLTIIGSLVSIAYSLVDSLWTIQDNQKIENELTNNRNKIPTSQAVYNGLAGKQNTLTAGQGISIVNNVISATGGNAHNYSTSEQVVGTWINGKPLYEKTIEIPAQTFSPNTITHIPHNIANLDFGFPVLGGLYYNSSESGLNVYNLGGTYANKNSQSLPTSNLFYVSVVNINSQNIDFSLGQSYTSTLKSGGFVVLRYTKSTD